MQMHLGNARKFGYVIFYDHHRSLSYLTLTLYDQPSESIRTDWVMLCNNNPKISINGPKNRSIPWSWCMSFSGHQEGSFDCSHLGTQAHGEVTISSSASCHSRRKVNTTGSHIDKYMVQCRSDSSHFHSISLARVGHMVSPKCKGTKKCNLTMCPEGEEPEMFHPQIYDHHLSQIDPKFTQSPQVWPRMICDP